MTLFPYTTLFRSRVNPRMKKILKLINIKNIIDDTTRFHSFIDGHIPSVSDKTFVGKVFTDYITDGILPSEYLLSVIPHSVAISVGNTKKLLPMVLPTDRARQKKKSFPLGIYRQNIFRRCCENTDGLAPSAKMSVIFYTDRIFPLVKSSVNVYRRIISVGDGG